MHAGGFPPRFLRGPSSERVARGFWVTGMGDGRPMSIHPRSGRVLRASLPVCRPSRPSGRTRCVCVCRGSPSRACAPERRRGSTSVRGTRDTCTCSARSRRSRRGARLRDGAPIPRPDGPRGSWVVIRRGRPRRRLGPRKVGAETCSRANGMICYFICIIGIPKNPQYLNIDREREVDSSGTTRRDCRLGSHRKGSMCHQSRVNTLLGTFFFLMFQLRLGIYPPSDDARARTCRGRPASHDCPDTRILAHLGSFIHIIDVTQVVSYPW